MLGQVGLSKQCRPRSKCSSKLLLLSVWLSLDVSQSTDRMANSVYPDQTAPVGAV